MAGYWPSSLPACLWTETESIRMENIINMLINNETYNEFTDLFKSNGDITSLSYMLDSW